MQVCGYESKLTSPCVFSLIKMQRLSFPMSGYHQGMALLDPYLAKVQSQRFHCKTQNGIGVHYRSKCVPMIFLVFWQRVTETKGNNSFRKMSYHGAME